MNTDQNTALYEKMAAEQDKFRDWLKSQPPEEILNHAYEYTVREDILMAMEELDLPQSRATALLASPSPLADVYKEFADRETSYMDVVRDSIEQRAEAALDAQRELPLYRWNNTTCHIRRTFLVWKPLNRQSILTMVRAGWIQRRRSKTFWKSTEQNGYSLFLPTRSGTKAVMGGSPTTIKLGQRRFTCRRTVVLPIAMPIWWWMGSIPA